LLKRSLDVTVGIGALIVLSPVLVLIALLVILDSGFPILFKQERVGRAFRTFYIFKFRTMRAGNCGPLVTVRGDARVTPVGRVLRRTKLDELPQFWNVLVGNMSLVGPRPEVPAYVSLYVERYRKVLSVRPGITDLASVRFRTEEDVLASDSNPHRFYTESVLPAKLDLAEEYVRTQNFRLDLRILLVTATSILGCFRRCQ
jgi:lipopolysaccharide/colanic/teichoic acid biosynthesis glycosyltransferase